jgi:hypothetical protein
MSHIAHREAMSLYQKEPPKPTPPPYIFDKPWKAFLFFAAPCLVFLVIYLAPTTGATWRTEAGSERTKVVIGFSAMVAADSFFSIAGINPIATQLFVEREKLLTGTTKNFRFHPLVRWAVFGNCHAYFTPENLVDFITGRATPFRWFELRGNGPCCLAGFINGLVTGALVSSWVYKESGVSSLLLFPDTSRLLNCLYMALALVQYLQIMLSLVIGWFTVLVCYALRTFYIPYQLLCIQVGGALKPAGHDADDNVEAEPLVLSGGQSKLASVDEDSPEGNPEEWDGGVGLWNRSDPRLIAVQSLSMYLVLVVAITFALVIIGIFLVGIPIYVSAMGALGCIFLIITLLLAPILPVVTTLIDAKTKLTSRTSRLIEEQQLRVLSSFEKHVRGDDMEKEDNRQQHAHEVQVLKELSEYHKEIEDISTYPSGLKLFYTGLVSILLTSLPLLAAQLGFLGTGS